MKTYLKHIPKELEHHIRLVEYKKGSEILEEGSKNEYMYFIEEGIVEVYSYSKQGHRISINFFKEGESFGILEILDENRLTANVIALSDCKIKRLPKEAVLTWMKEDFQFTMRIISLLQSYLSTSTFIMQTLQSMTIKERIIVSLYRHFSDMTLRYLTKEILIQETGAQRRTINRVLVELYKEELILYKNKEFIILNIDELEKAYNRII